MPGVDAPLEPPAEGMPPPELPCELEEEPPPEEPLEPDDPPEEPDEPPLELGLDGIEEEEEDC